MNDVALWADGPRAATLFLKSDSGCRERKPHLLSQVGWYQGERGAGAGTYEMVHTKYV